MLLSTIIGKKLVNIETAFDLGCVNAFTYHNGFIEYFVSDTGMAVKTCDICNISDAITCKMHYSYSEIEYPLLCIRNVDICSIKGKSLGTLQDILIDDNYCIKRLLTDLKNILKFRIVSYSDTTLVLDKPSPIKKQLTPIELSIPTVITNYNFLMNRTLFRNILSRDGTVQFTRGQLITKNDINKARDLGKLVQLTLYSTPIK